MPKNRSRARPEAKPSPPAQIPLFSTTGTLLDTDGRPFARVQRSIGFAGPCSHLNRGRPVHSTGVGGPGRWGEPWDHQITKRPLVLRSIAAALERSRDLILSTASNETRFVLTELEPEFARTVGTLRMFANLVEDGPWVRATIDTPNADPALSIGPNHDVRSLLVASRVVAVFGSSNFPLAYGVVGGDTASALAAGCAVIVKEHPAHPRTGRLLAAIARHAIAAAGSDPGQLGYTLNTDPHDHSLARELVKHSTISAVGFTGSRTGGEALIRLAAERPHLKKRPSDPIPVFAEMGSLNPVRITPAALRVRGPAIARELAAAIALRHGQQCTKPGMIWLPDIGRATDRFERELAKAFSAMPIRRLAAPWIEAAFRARIRQLTKIPGVRIFASSGRSTPRAAANAVARAADPPGVPAVLLRTSVGPYLKAGSLIDDETFGPTTTIVRTGIDDWRLPAIPGLTSTIFAEPRDLSPNHGVAEFVARFEPRRVGRFIINGPPTGVRVCHAMVHSGPWPSCSRPDSTAVGPRAIERWCRPICFQNAPDDMLPLELRDSNPLGLLRLVNGRWTRRPLSATRARPPQPNR